MSSPSLHVVSVDYLSTNAFVFYFSDGTYATMTPEELASCIPDNRRQNEDLKEVNGALDHLL